MFNPMQIFQMFGGQQNMLGQHQQMMSEYQRQGINPQMQVQQMLNSGRISQEQFNQARMIANILTGRGF